MKKHILCLGNIAYDLIIKNDKLDSRFFIEGFPGGSVFNTALILAKLRAPVLPITKTGNDFLGNKLLSTMKKHKINTSCTFLDNNVKTALALAHLDKKKDSSYIFYRPENKNISLTNENIKEEIFKNAAILHTGSAYTYKDITYEDTIYFLRKAKKHNIPVSYDPNWRENRIKNTLKARKRIYSILEHIDILKLSESDALGITGKKTLNSALKRLPDNTIVTLGAKGAFHKKDKTKYFVPAFKVKTADTIGAGDAFTAGIIYKYSQQGPSSLNETLNETLRFASGLSALICIKHGATSGVKNISQVKTFLSK